MNKAMGVKHVSLCTVPYIMLSILNLSYKVA